MPQQQPPVGADVSSLMPQVGADVSHLMGGGGTPAAKPAERSWLDSTKDFLGEALKSVDPRGINAGVQQAFWHPLDTVSAMGQAQGALKDKAEDAFKKGDYAEGVRHVLSYLIPVLGPRLDQAGDYMQKGEIAKGLGATTDVAAQAFGPKVLKDALPASTGALAANPNAAEAEAVAFGQRQGIPVDAATATGNPFVRGTQKLADQSLGGSVVGQRAQAAQAQGLATVGEQLAAKSNPAAVTTEQAGQAVREGVTGAVHKAHGDASIAYERLRKMEEDPRNLSVIEPEVVPDAPDAPMRFVSKPKATSDEIFLSALQDARKQGYKGTAAELKGQFDDRVASAKRLREATLEGDEYGHAQFLKAIRDLGGLRMYDKNYVAGAKTTRMTSEFDNVKGFFKGQRIYTEKGLAADDMVMQLRQDPRWASVLDDSTDLNEMLREIATARGEGASSGDLQHFLRGEGVRPGAKWWEAQKPAQEIKMAVDLTASKAALKPTYDTLKREAELVPLVGDKARALTSLDRLLNGPDYAPLSVVDAALGELKTFARADNPDLRTIGQGKAHAAIQNLDLAVRQAAERAGPEAVRALGEGRQATIAKYAAADVLDTLNAEPVRTAKGLTAPGDSALQRLRAVAQQAPQSVPQIARSVLDGFLDKATESGGFAHADKLYADWQKLGDGTKALLYKDPAYIKDLDNFFLLAKKLAENPNPSGSALTLAKGGELSLLISNPIAGAATSVSAMALSKLLHSPLGVKLLTKGLVIPARSGAATVYAAELSRAIGGLEGSMTPAFAGDPGARKQ